MTQPPTLNGYGLRGLGQDDGGDEGSGDGSDGGDSGDGSSGGTTPVDTTPPPCMPTGGVGPLQPNQVWCATGTGAPPVMSGSCAGTCTNGTFMDQSSCTCVGAPSLQSLGVTSSQIPGYGGPSGYSGPSVVPATSTPPTPPAGYEWASLINASGNTLAKVLAISQGGSAITLPNGQQLVFGSAASAAAGSLLSSSSLGSMLPLLLIAGGFLLLMNMRK